MPEHIQIEERNFILMHLFMELAQILFTEIESGKPNNELQQPLSIMKNIIEEVSKAESNHTA